MAGRRAVLLSRAWSRARRWRPGPGQTLVLSASRCLNRVFLNPKNPAIAKACVLPEGSLRLSTKAVDNIVIKSRQIAEVSHAPRTWTNCTIFRQ